MPIFSFVETQGEIDQQGDFFIHASASSGDELKALILERFPSYMAGGVLDIQNLFLYPQA